MYLASLVSPAEKLGVGNNSAVGGYSVRSNAIPAASLARQERSNLKGSATEISLIVSV